ncbi:hypothetical protein B195_011830 [Pseudomonas sp. Lz4W]|uniref:hypothetical protein n=1 Tax=Pseudomonas sp. Lz4W TaxID=1206777 RepID=UPI0002BE4BAE|nr:hypothetical protein [Pseudomonas sp. Lz4W]AUB75497.1 hypothetical protein B195_011830 [Pseudomonas sp. Lz4W]
MTSPADIISSIYYVSPYASLPPGRATAGLTVNVKQSSLPSTPPNLVLVTRLRLANDPMVIGVSPTSGAGTSPIYALFQPPFPLSATISYMVDLIWVVAGTSPAGIDWSQAVASAPVTAARVTVASAQYDGQSVTAQLDYGASSVQVGTQLLVYGFSGGVWALAGSANVEGNTATVKVADYPAPFRIYATALVPAVNPGGAGSFAAPFSQGPFSAPQTVPQAAASLTQADYDGSTLLLIWGLDNVQDAPRPQNSVISLQVNASEVAPYVGGPTSARFAAQINDSSGVSASVQTQAFAIGAAPLKIPLITAAPTVSGVIINGTAVEANVTTSAASSEGWLMRGSTVLVGPVNASSGKLSFTYAASGAVGLSVISRGKSADGKTSGPCSQPAMLLAIAPTLIEATIQSDPKNPQNWQIACQWAALPDSPSNVISYTVNVLQNGKSLATQTTSATAAVLSIAKSTVTQGQTQTLTLQATGISGGTSPSVTQALVFVTPQLRTLTATEDQLAVTWNVAAGLPADPPPSYAIRLINGSGAGANQVLLLGTITTGNASAVSLRELIVPADGSAVAMVDLLLGPLRVVADRTMASNQQATAILTTPRSLAAATNPATQLATLNWSTIGAGVSYTLQFSDGSTQTSSTTHYVLSRPAGINAGLRYQIAATRTDNGVVVIGPFSAAASVPTAADMLIDARYDGESVRARWHAHSGADAHVLSVYENAAPVASVTVNGTTGALAFNADPGKRYTVYVQPAGADGTGLAANAMALFVPAYFLSQQPATVATPYVYPASAQASLGSSISNPPPREITLYLPQLGLTADALGSESISVGPFTVAPFANAELPYTLTIATDAAVWSFDTTAVRTTLQSDYVQLLAKLEKPKEGLAGASPYGIYLVQSAIARMMPQTFDEQLYYNFGLSFSTRAGSAYVDLRPGMVLRVVLGDYVSINEQGLPTWLNGYAGASVVDFDIGSYHTNGAWRVGFDGFLNELAAHNALQVEKPFQSMSGTGQSGVAAAADLYFSQFQQPYYRVFLPASLLSPSSTSSGNQANLNFAIVAAQSFTAINDAKPDPQQFSTVYFRGRTTLEVMIRVQLDGNERQVPVGTRLGNLLEERQLRPSTVGRSAGLRLLRASGAGQTATSAADSLGVQLEVMLDWQGGTVYAPGSGFDGYSLPLLAGDHIITVGC